MNVDLRSNDATALAELDGRFLAIVKKAAEDENAKWNDSRITVEIKRFGNRPPASQSSEAPIVQVACAAVETLGGIPELGNPSSTDANHPMSLGVPAITIGLGGTFGSAHTLEEWHDPTNGHLAIQKSLMTILGLVGMENTSPALLRK